MIVGRSGTGRVQTTQPSGFLFDDDFATGNKSKTMNGVQWWQNGVNSTVVDDPGSPSGKALRLRTTIWDAAEECWCEQRFYLGPLGETGIYTDLTFRYKMLIPANYWHPNGPVFAGPPATNSDNNKWLRVWSRGPQFPLRDGYSPYYYKGGFSLNPLASPGAGSRLMTEWGSDSEPTPNDNQGVGQNNTPNLPWIDPADCGTEVEFVMRVKADTIGPINSRSEQTGGNGALQAWKNGVRIANLTTLQWRSATGTHDFFEYGYVTGYLNQGWSSSYDWMLRRFTIAAGPGGPAAFGVS
jgi:hypothetical protein